MHLARQQGLCDFAAALVGHAHHVDAGLLLEALGAEGGTCGGTDGGVVDLARIGLGVGNELGQRVGGSGGVHDQGVIALAQHANRGVVLYPVQRLAVGNDVARERGVGHQQAVAQRHGAIHVAQGHQPAAAGLDVCDEGHTEFFAQFGADIAGVDVGSGARSEHGHQANGARGIGLRQRLAGNKCGTQCECRCPLPDDAHGRSLCLSGWDGAFLLRHDPWKGILVVSRSVSLE